MKSQLVRLALIVAAGIATPMLASAQATPNHVYQAVGVLEAYANSYRQADLLPTVKARHADAPAFKPRHVLFRAIMLQNRVDLLRRLHGLGPGPEIAVGSAFITPQQVARVIGQLQSSIAELAPIYGLDTAPEAESLPSGKQPGDVYVRLSHVIALLDDLYLPRTAPNDVFQMADTALGEVRLLADAAGLASDVTHTERAATGTPKDVYEAVIGAARDLQAMTERRRDIAPSGGVVIPKPPSQKVTPSDVARAVMLLLADLHEMRLKAGAKDQLHVAAAPTGKVPADVGGRIGQVRDVLAALR